jgi:exodeoxyribonuclease V alpha subunit
MNEYDLQVKKMIYEDEESSFYIFTGEDLDDPSANDRKVKGNFYSVAPRPGLEMRIEGEWENSKYGWTLNAHRSEPLLISEEGVRNYLVTSINDMSVLHAHKLTNAFGQEALNKLRNDDDELYELDFVEDHEISNYVNQLDFTESYSDAIKDLISFGIPSHLVKDVYLAMGDGDIDTLRDNPYLLMEVDGLSFQEVDKIAIRAGADPRCTGRVAACIEYLLRRAEKSGHLYMDLSTVRWKVNKVPTYLDTPSFGEKLEDDEIWEGVKHLMDEGRAVVEDDRIYFQRNHEIEAKSAKKLSQMVGSYDLGIDTDDFIENYEDVHKIEFSEEQTEAIRALNNHKVFLLTGLPGTGKTTVVKALVRLFQKAEKEFDLVCPTGIAAKKLGTVVGEEAKTIHRLLGYDGYSWDYDENQRYQTDAVIVDEASMMDQDLLYRLVSALKNDTAIVFVGDFAQLPSVGAGNVLREMIRSQSIKQVNLTEIFRQGEASDIVLNAHRINAGKELLYNDPKDSETDFRFIPENDPDRIIEGLLSFVKKLYDHPDAHTFQVLSPTYKTSLGVDNLNRRIKEVLNPQEGAKLERRLGDKNFREDDRIMITENHYEKDVFNGEQGKIRWIKQKDDKIRTKIFDQQGDKIVDFSFEEAKRMLVLSYAMTCHKSQGQEWDYVLFPFHEKFNYQLQRNLLYTSVTRAKNKVFILGQRSAIRKAVDNDRVEDRNTKFSERLRELID